jgi:putative NIF3 family GTP cyclohydrolase 1 type 2
MTTARDIDDFFIGLDPKVRERRTCDGFKFGSADAAVSGIACMWMAVPENIGRAHESGANLIITHEPTFFNHWDETEEFAQDQVYKDKVALLEKTGMTVIRIHDVWDRFPEFGIHDSWARRLGLTEAVRSDARHTLFRIDPTQLARFAQRVQERMGVGGVRFAGPPERLIKHVALGMGAWGGIGDLKMCMALGADVFITGETVEWQTVRFALESGMTMIVVGHNNSEEFGIQAMAGFLSQHFPGLSVIYVPTADPYHHL